MQKSRTVKQKHYDNSLVAKYIYQILSEKLARKKGTPIKFQIFPAKSIWQHFLQDV